MPIIRVVLDTRWWAYVQKFVVSSDSFGKGLAGYWTEQVAVNNKEKESRSLFRGLVLANSLLRPGRT